MKEQRPSNRGQTAILEVQAWKERGGWQDARQARRRPEAPSVVRVDAVVKTSHASQIILTVVLAAAVLFAVV